MTRKMRPHRVLTMAVVALTTLLLLVPGAQAMKLKNQNLAQLIADSNSIVFGTVSQVTDGFDAKGVPFTEVTIAVGSAAKGNLDEGDDYSFRQFGLLKPRNMGNGKIYLGVSPEGFPRWREGETVVAFLREPASITGLQTTAGMGQGKLVLRDGELVNEFNNVGLFEGMQIDSSLLNAEQQNMIVNPGSVKAGAFIDLVGRAVREQWIEKGVMK